VTSLLPLVLFALLVVLAISAWRQRHRRSRLGPGAAGAVYDFLNEDKRAALEIVVEERASYRDPEDRDGDLPQLEAPTQPGDHSRSDR